MVQESRRTKDTVFVRKATGLVREMSPHGALIYNVMTIGVAALVYVYITAAFAYPDGSVPLAFLITGIFAVITMLPYAMLASSLPRSGGDYVYQTRAKIPPFWAFGIVFAGLVLWEIAGTAIAGFFVSVVGLAPLFTTLGAQTGSSLLANIGVWCAQPIGEMLITLALILFTTLIMIRGLRVYQRLQWWLAASLGLSVVLMIIFLGTASHTSFVSDVNNFMSHFGASNFYNSLMSSVSHTGHNLLPAITVLGTLGIAPAIWTQLSVAMWSVQQGGEIKSARHLNRQLYMIIGSVVIVTVIGIILALQINHIFGRGFVNALAYAEDTGQPALNYVPFFDVIVAWMSHNIIVEILIPLGFLANAIQFAFSGGIAGTRIMLAMSFDGLLPERVSRVSDRYHTPVFSIVGFYVAAAIVGALYMLVTRLQTFFLSLGLATSLVILTTMTAAVIFPYTARDIFNSSPASRYKILGIPVMSIAGVIGFAWTGYMAYLWLSNPNLGIANAGSEIVIGASFLICMVYYFVWVAMRRRSGVDVARAFAEIPPE